MKEHVSNPFVFLIEHVDGLRSAALMLNDYISDWAYAGRLDGDIQACEFYLQPGGPGANFGYLSRNIQRFFTTGEATYPPERTLLTSGVIDAVMRSRHEGNRLVETPYLDIAYSSYTQEPIRPRGERPGGACLDRNTPDVFLPWKDN